MESIVVPDLEAGHLPAGRICATRPSAASNIALHLVIGASNTAEVVGSR
jgi:hypothetical protein